MKFICPETQNRLVSECGKTVVGKNQVGRTLPQFPDEIVTGLDPFGTEGEATLAQFVIDHHHVGGDIFHNQDV